VSSSTRDSEGAAGGGRDARAAVTGVLHEKIRRAARRGVRDRAVGADKLHRYSGHGAGRSGCRGERQQD
jgi:hypothetical protein